MHERKIGAYIAAKRKERGLTQEALGHKLGVTGKAVSKWERGICLPDIDIIHSLSSVLLCRTDNILNGCDDPVWSSDKNGGSSVMESESVESKEYDIELSDKAYTVSPLLFGGNIEHTRSTVTGGLSAQMLRNRKFAGMPRSFRGNADEWFIIGSKTYAMLGNDRTFGGNINDNPTTVSYTCHSPLGYHMKRRYERNSQLIQSFISGEIWGIGQHCICAEKGKEYELNIVLQTDTKVKLEASITSRNSKVCYAKESTVIDGDTWKNYTIKLKSCADDSDADLNITFTDSARVVIGVVSLMPTDNFCGMRRDVVDALKECNVKLLRWPGGNFAGEYNWLDGLLPRDMRAPLETYIHQLTQPHTMGYDFSEINTDDFIMLCKEIGAVPSITINTTWNTPEENAAWVEYCNGDATTQYGKMRIERGFEEPFNVKYWSLGNEAGYGHMEGDNSPEGYVRIAKENAQAMLKADPDITLCSSGCHPNSEWEKASNQLSSMAPMAALHNYVNFPTYVNPNHKKQELEKYMQGIEECREKIHLMRRGLSKDVSIAFDEWNCWYSWYRPRDTFSGLFTAKMFNMFISEQKNSNVSLAAIFQPINEGCICVLPDHCELTPMGQAHTVMSQHSDGRVLYISDNIAATKKDKIITITLVNDAYDTKRSYSINVNGKILLSNSYVAEDIGPFSEFKKTKLEINRESGNIKVTLLPMSINEIKISAE